MPRPRRGLTAVLGLLLSGCPRGAPGTPAVIARVNGEAITALDFRKDLAMSRRGSEGLGPRSEEELRSYQKDELRRLIQRTELLQVARRYGIVATDVEVDKEFLSMRADYPGTSFDELLADEEISPVDLRTRLREQLTVQKLFTREVFSRVVVTEPEIERYEATHAADLARPDQVHAEQIVVKTDEEAQALRAAIEAGKLSFAEAAKKHSLSPDAREGGDLGWFSHGMMPPVFEEVCFGLPVGVLSEVIPSSYGFHLFRVLERRPAGALTPAEAHARIEATLREEKNALAEAAFLADLASKGHVTVDEAAAARVQ